MNRIVLILILASTSLPATASHWPGWRGNGTGVALDKGLPSKWSTNENVRWRVDLPGRGNSSPVVWEDRVFVNQAVNADNRRTVMCFDRASGKLLWQSGVTYTEREQTQRDNPYCAATPVTDGERVIGSFGSAGLYCYDFKGKELWHRDFGKMDHNFGNASSPMLAGDLCIFNFGPDDKARLIAVNKRTGETAWEIEPPKPDTNELQRSSRGFDAAGGPPGDGPNRGRGGGNNPGIGANVAPQMFAQADKNTDKKLSRDEFVALADTWFDKLDPNKAGKLTEDQFAERFYDAVPRRETPGESNDNRPAGRSRTTAPAFFSVLNTDKDDSLTRAEIKTAFGKWFGEWDASNAGSIDEEKLLAGLNAVLPRQQVAQGGAGGRGGRGGGGPGGGRGPGGGSTWSTPILVTNAGREELVMNFPYRLVGLDPKTGKQLWMSKGVGGTIYTTPVSGEGVLFAMTSGPGGGGAIAVKPGQSGSSAEQEPVWKLDRVKSSIGSGIVHEGHLYLIYQDGIASCLNLKDGKTVWEERLRGAGSRNSSWSSMILAGDKIYVPNQSGDVFVLRASPKFELLATNSVREPTNASLAVSDGEIFMRTDAGLWCFAEGKR